MDEITMSNLRANMAKHNVKVSDVAEALNITPTGVAYKLNCERAMRLEEAIIIRDKLFKNYTLDKLYLDK